MAKNNKQRLGEIGEELATNYLITKGFLILERNYRIGRTEIDIIAQREKLLIFVEVKTRSSAVFGFPEEAVSTAKAARIVAAAERYVIEKNWQQMLRFDIVAIENTTPPQINHFEDAFC